MATETKTFPSSNFYVSGSSFVCIFRISDDCFLNVRDSLFGDNKKYIQFKYKDYVFHLSGASFEVFLSAIKCADVQKAHLNTTTWIEKLPDGVMIKRFGAKTVLTYEEIEVIKKESADILAVVNNKLPLYKMASKSLFNQQNDDDDDIDLIMSEPSDCEEDGADSNNEDDEDTEINEVIKKTDGYNELDSCHEMTDIMMPKNETETIDLTQESESEDDDGSASIIRGEIATVGENITFENLSGSHRNVQNMTANSHDDNSSQLRDGSQSINHTHEFESEDEDSTVKITGSESGVSAGGSNINNQKFFASPQNGQKMTTNSHCAKNMMTREESPTMGPTDGVETEDEDGSAKIIQGESVRSTGGWNDYNQKITESTKIQKLSTSAHYGSTGMYRDQDNGGQYYGGNFVFRSAYHQQLPKKVDPPKSSHQIEKKDANAHKKDDEQPCTSSQWSNVKNQNNRRKSTGDIDTMVPQKMTKSTLNRQTSVSTPAVITNHQGSIMTNDTQVDDTENDICSEESTRFIIDENK